MGGTYAYTPPDNLRKEIHKQDKSYDSLDIYDLSTIVGHDPIFLLTIRLSGLRSDPIFHFQGKKDRKDKIIKILKVF